MLQLIFLVRKAILPKYSSFCVSIKSKNMVYNFKTKKNPGIPMGIPGRVYEMPVVLVLGLQTVIRNTQSCIITDSFAKRSRDNLAHVIAAGKCFCFQNIPCRRP